MKFGHDFKDGKCQLCHVAEDDKDVKTLIGGVCPESEGGKWRDEQIEAIRASERITAADLAITINARD